MKLKTPIIATAFAVALALTGCAASAGSTTQTGTDSAVTAKITAGLAELKGKVFSTGPAGETAAPASAADLTSAEIDKIKSLHLTAAISLHIGGNDWSTAQVAGLKSEFGKLGITVVGVTDANFDPARQVADIETLMAKKPNILISIPTDPVATAGEFRKASAEGAHLVFMDNVPAGFVAGKDYVSVVSADNYGNGVTSAYMMARALGGKGTIGIVYHQADFFVTKQRYQAFKKTITDKFPDIKIVDEKGIAGPDFAGDAQSAAGAMLTKYPTLSGIWAVWDVPADGVMAAARAAGRTDLKIATEDLGTNSAVALAKNKLLVGLGAQRPFDQGVTEARLAAASWIGKTVPGFIALPSLAVDHSNVLEMWKTVYHTDVPAAVKDAYKK